MYKTIKHGYDIQAKIKKYYISKLRYLYMYSSIPHIISVLE